MIAKDVITLVVEDAKLSRTTLQDNYRMKQVLFDLRLLDKKPTIWETPTSKERISRLNYTSEVLTP